MVLKVNDLTGGYSKIPVLKDVSFNVPDKTIAALIGLNGAGKSTTIKHIIGLLRPLNGEITINGLSFYKDKQKYLQKIAYIPERPVLYPELTLKEHIDLTIMAYNLNYKNTWMYVNDLLNKFRLLNKLDWFPIQFSKGMQQKVMIICAFITNASLYIVDEPFTGLDPLAMDDFLELIINKKNKGSSILMSTHILSTAQKYADIFILLNQGKIIAEGDMNYLREKFDMKNASLNDIYLKMIKDTKAND